MCGINGILFRQPVTDMATRIAAMNNRIIHRGPDDSGIYVYGERLGLGMQRLSIIDLVHGHQPLFNDDNTLAIVFNGEIYNFLELRRELIGKGVNFKTHSDTEVVLRMYEAYGTAAFSKLNGMFALAIHDVRKQQVILARDRFGEKPLYYYKNDDNFAWASELKSLKGQFQKEQQIDPNALQLFLGLTYIPAPYTIYQHIYKLQAGRYMVIDMALMNHSIHQYWNISLVQTEPVKDYSAAKKELRNLLFDSVEKRMIADVPIGVFLSGGVDSTIIASIMAKCTDQKINSFSIGFANKRYDESERARQVATHIGAAHHEYVLNYNDILDEIDTIILNYDEPFADSSCLPAWYVSRKTATQVKVALTGDGGDEVFGGYNKYLIHTYGKLYQQLLPAFVREKLISPAVNSKRWKNLDSKSVLSKLRKLIASAGNDVVANHFNIISLGFGKKDLEQLLKQIPANDTDAILAQYLDQPTHKVAALKLARYLDKNISLEGDMLVKVDRASMLCSLECRAPFLDHRLMEFSYRIPDDFLIKGSNKKRILKDAFEDLLPPGFFNAPKSGFEIPIAGWFRMELKNDLLKTLSEEQIAEQALFNYPFIHHLINEHINRQADHSFKLWTLYCFQKWYNANKQ